MKLAAITFGAGIGLVVAFSASAAQEERDASVRAAAIKIMQAKLGPLRGTIPITARKTLLTRQMIEQLKPIPQNKLSGSPGIDMITTDSIRPSSSHPNQSFPVIDFNKLISGN